MCFLMIKECVLLLQNVFSPPARAPGGQGTQGGGQDRGQHIGATHRGYQGRSAGTDSQKCSLLCLYIVNVQRGTKFCYAKRFFLFSLIQPDFRTISRSGGDSS